jgi:excisionase family DNA binding protein
MENTMPILDSTIEMTPILTVENVAEYLQVHPSTIYCLLKQKRIPAFKVGSDWRFNRESIDRWCVDAERI